MGKEKKTKLKLKKNDEKRRRGENRGASNEKASGLLDEAAFSRYNVEGSAPRRKPSVAWGIATVKDVKIGRDR